MSGLHADRRFFVGLLAMLSLLAPLCASAEVRVRAGIEIYESAVRIAPEEWRLATTGLGSLTFEATGSTNVRGDLSLSMPVTDLLYLVVDRAYVRFRLPWFRMTMGAAPLSWGEGLLINAGDLPNPAYDPTADLLSGDFRVDPVWQAELYVPIGPFSFLEAVALPQLIDPSTGTIPEFSSTAVGGRAYVDADVFALQLGYLLEDPVHRFYTSIQASAGVDLYLNLAHEVSVGETDLFGAILDSIVISGGGFYTFSLGRDMSLALRAEGQVKAADLDAGLASGASVAGTADLTLSPTVTLGVQSLFAPVDPSTLVATSIRWNVDQGLTLLGLVQANVGAADSVFPADGYGGFTVTAGARYVY